MLNTLFGYFEFTRGERRGIYLLLLLILFFFILPHLVSRFKKPEKIDFSQFQKEIDAYHQSSDEAVVESTQIESQEIIPFKFDPNTLPKEQFLKLGLKPKLVETILNYRSKGGKFYKKKDFKKIYGLSEEIYEKLEDYIEIRTPDKKKPMAFAAKLVTYEKPTPTLFEFDPNTLEEAGFLKLGLSEKLTKIILKYRSKGGKFFQKEDLKKIYGMKEEQYAQLEPFVKIEAQKEEALIKSVDHKPAYTIEVDINTASVEDWQQLNGIGPGYSKRIVKFRNVLGGFTSIEQVAETFGLPDSTFQKIKPSLKWSAFQKQLNVNTATAKELAKHPYLHFKEALAIVNYRNQHGAYKSFEEVAKALSVYKNSKWRKMKEYLIYN